MATVRSTKLRKDSLWLKDEAPDWQLLADRMWLKSKHPWVASKAWVRRLLGKH